RNEAYREIEESQRALKGELAEAAAYVRSLLPPPIEGEIQANWRFIPSAQLGGDVFGYHWIDERHFAIYLLDVCGHGVGAALLSVSVMNVLGAQNLPKGDFTDPSSILTSLNAVFQMENHNNMFFTIWYGVYDKIEKTLVYASAGHPPAILVMSNQEGTLKGFELMTPGVVIGALPVAEFQNNSIKIEGPNCLYVYSDGIYEINKIDGPMLELQEFTSFLKKTPQIAIDQIIESIQSMQGKIDFNDDVSILEINFIGEE
ncbi:MAG: PP2C family protein-serine/threonine phosphatase, partial [Parachlamydia sp.]|nr:PP2C family protein-serine/threonine phosphatase [Parachlamydia sp.]